ncbi:Nicotinamide riboside kinase [Madurella mycetomatis]|uniref:Nicotinamide riboside kinase n=1 Tax=Madurella mycetomatis TaxID=100816 RepID=A0A175WAY2_9PEZI|nr:Nicotinamide riboside kinase [Madurella mycetomatis]
MPSQNDLPAMGQRRAVIIGISGCSSSGKTTLARLLRDIFPETFILHEDDFYKPESELPIKDGFADWDCPEAISIPDLELALSHIRATGTFPVSSSVPNLRRLSHRSDHGCVPVPLFSLSPPLLNPSTSPLSLPSPFSSSSSFFSSSPQSSLPSSPSTRSSLTTTTTLRGPPQQPNVTSIEDLNTVGACPATPAQISACAAKVRDWLSPGQPGSRIFPAHNPAIGGGNDSNDNSDHRQPGSQLRLCLVDGFLLYAPPALARVMTLLDVKLFLRVSRARAVGRRQARDGYVTLDGFWKDPPGYVEKVVWPNYADAHRWLFEGGRVDGGRLDAEVLRREGIEALDGAEEGAEDAEFGRVLEWAVDAVMRGLERVVLGEGAER